MATPTPMHTAESANSGASRANQLDSQRDLPGVVLVGSLVIVGRSRA
jgi:hypothetical protein